MVLLVVSLGMVVVMLVVVFLGMVVVVVVVLVMVVLVVVVVGMVAVVVPSTTAQQPSPGTSGQDARLCPGMLPGAPNSPRFGWRHC